MSEAGRILVVDDDPSLLRLMDQYLRRLGYDVVATSDPQDAVRLFDAEPESFQMVLADSEMPGLSGEQLAARMLPRSPRLAILICSGYPFDLSVLPPGSRRQVGFLQKPFLPKMLAEAVDQLLRSAAQ